MSMLPVNTEDVSLDKIILGTSQARQRDTKVNEGDDLVLSIRKHGLISPIVVKLLEDGRYELLIGQRRLRAHEILKKLTIRAYVVDKNVDEYDAMKLSLVENAARKDMKPADYTDTIHRLLEKYNSTKTVAEEAGLSLGKVRKYVRIGRLPPEIQNDVRSNKYDIPIALKALKALGDDEYTVDPEMLRAIAIEMNQLSRSVQNKFVEIKINEPNIPIPKIVEKAKKRAVTHEIRLVITEDLHARLNRFKEQEEDKKR